MAQAIKQAIRLNFYLRLKPVMRNPLGVQQNNLRHPMFLKDHILLYCIGCNFL